MLRPLVILFLLGLTAWAQESQILSQGSGAKVGHDSC